MTQPGTVLVLNGTSSAGKSSIALALRDLLPEPFLHTGVDHFLKQLPPAFSVRTADPAAQDVDGFLLVFRDGALAELPRIGPGGRRVLAGMYAAIAAYARQGNRALVDDVIYDRRVLASAASELHALPAYFVAVHCALAVAEQRERERRDRAPGGARLFDAVVHAHGVYDFEVDSTGATSVQCAEQIRDWLLEAPQPRAFTALYGLEAT